MSGSVSIRSLFEGYPGKDTNPSLRGLVSSNPPLEASRTHEEDIVHAMLPGDDPENHPRYTKNLYFNESYPNLKSLVESCSLPPVEQRLAEEALLWMEGSKPSRPSRG